MPPEIVVTHREVGVMVEWVKASQHLLTSKASSSSKFSAAVFIVDSIVMLRWIFQAFYQANKKRIELLVGIPRIVDVMSALEVINN